MRDVLESVLNMPIESKQRKEPDLKVGRPSAFCLIALPPDMIECPRQLWRFAGWVSTFHTFILQQY